MEEVFYLYVYETEHGHCKMKWRILTNRVGNQTEGGVHAVLNLIPVELVAHKDVHYAQLTYKKSIN